jgi:hypothetical protein
MDEEKKITIPEIIVLDKKFSRTFNQEDSLLANCRRALQREFSAIDFENKIIPNLPDEELQFLLNYYEKRSSTSGEGYYLRTIPLRISFERADLLLKESSISEEDKAFLLTLYQQNESIKKYELRKNITEADEVKILKMFNVKSLHISNVQRAMLSEILEKVEDIPKKNTFYANLYIPPKHKFFTPPNLKHISGMTLTEAARQLGIACCHLFGKVPLEDVTFLLQAINTDFYQYCKINMPVKIRAVLNEHKLNKDKSWNYVDYTISIFQENAEISRVTIRATILPLKVYKRLKSTQEEVYEIDPRFQPSEKFKNNISIRYFIGDTVKKWVCQIENFSRGGFMVRSEGAKPPEQLENAKDLQFFMHFDLAGFIHGKCENVWFRPSEEHEDCFFGGFKITDFTTIDKENLNEAISRYGRLIENREII